MQFDTIIMGSQGFGSFNKEGLGSVATYVKENAECTVILVEGMPDDKFNAQK